MKPNTALGLAASGVSLFLATYSARGRGPQAALGFLVGLFGGVFLIEYATGQALGGLDNFLLHDDSDLLPGRPSVATSTSLVAIGAALVLAPSRGALAEAIRSALAVGCMILALTAVVGYFVTPIDPSVHRIFFGFAIHTAASFFMLSVGILAAASHEASGNPLLRFGAPVLGLVALATLVVVSLMNVEAQKRSQDSIGRAVAVEGQLTRVLVNFQNALAQSRNYLFLGDARYLAGYAAALADLRAATEHLEALAAVEKSLGGKAQVLRLLADQKFASLDRINGLKRAGDAEGALAAVKEDATTPILQSFRDTIAAMQDEESGKVEVSSAASDREGAQLQLSILLTVSVIGAMAIFLLLDARRRFDELRSLQRNLVAANANLDKDVAAKTADLAAALGAARNALVAEKAGAADRARLAAIVSSSSDSILSKDADGVVTSWNAAATRLFGYAAEEVIGEKITHLIPSDRLDEEKIIQARLARGETIDQYETKRIAKDGRQIDVSVTISPIKDAEGQVLGASKIVRDITERRKAEENIRLLMGEVNHRSKNLLSVVQSIAVLSSKLADPATFSSDLLKRIASLSACQDLLLQSNWRGVDVADLVRAQLAPFRELIDRRIYIEGPIVRLSAAAAQAIGMATHELATNAAKYGALSNNGGRVQIGWEVKATEDASTFRMNWREEGGPKVEAPTRQGFGQKVIVSMVERAVSGKVKVEYREAGIVWKLTAPVQSTLETATPLQPTDVPA